MRYLRGRGEVQIIKHKVQIKFCSRGLYEIKINQLIKRTDEYCSRVKKL